MSLPEFATLLAQHPDEDAAAISNLENVIVHSLRRDRNSRFDVALVLSHLRQDNGTPKQAKQLLAELVRERALDLLLFWQCPNGKGPILEHSDISAFPDQIDCDRCGQVHWFDAADIEVGFVATPRLRDEIAEQDDAALEINLFNLLVQEKTLPEQDDDDDPALLGRDSEEPSEV